MWLAIAIGSAILFGLAGWWMKVSQMRGGSTRTLLLGLYCSGSAGFGVHAWLEGTFAGLFDWRVWAAGLVIGAGSAWGNALFMKALEYGPASLTSPLTNMNIVLVVAMATIWYGEPLSLAQGIGISLLLLSVMLIAYKRKEPLSIKEKRWFLILALAILMFALRNGGLKVTDQIGLASAPILLVAYALSVLWFLLPSSEQAGGEQAGGKQADREAASKRRIGLKLGLAAGLFSYGGLQLYAIAISTGQANLAAPIFATNSLVVAIGSIMLYKERLSLQQWAAFLLTLAGLIVIRL